MHVFSVVAGWHQHPVSRCRYHFVVPAADGPQSLAEPQSLPGQVEAGFLALHSEQTPAPSAVPSASEATSEALQLTGAGEPASASGARAAEPQDAAAGAEAGGSALQRTIAENKPASARIGVVQTHSALPGTGVASDDAPAGGSQTPAALSMGSPNDADPQLTVGLVDSAAAASACDVLPPKIEESAAAALELAASAVFEHRAADGPAEQSHADKGPLAAASDAASADPVSVPGSAGINGKANMSVHTDAAMGQPEADRLAVAQSAATADEAGPAAEGGAGRQPAAGDAATVVPAGPSADAGIVSQHAEVSFLTLRPQQSDITMLNKDQPHECTWTSQLTALCSLQNGADIWCF